MNKERIKWNDIPSPLQNYFTVHWFLSIVFVIIMLIIALTSGLYKIFISLAVIGLLYGAYILYLYWQTKNAKMLMYEGVCETVKKDVTAIPNPNPFKKAPMATIYGKCQLTIRINETNYVVPINQKFEVEEGNEIQVYTLNTGIFEINENSYIINNPVLVWKSKL